MRQNIIIEKIAAEDLPVFTSGGPSPTKLSRAVCALLPNEAMKVMHECPRPLPCPTRNRVTAIASRYFGRGVIRTSHDANGILYIHRLPEAGETKEVSV